MSVGIAGFSTGVAIAKQTAATSGTLATTGFILYPAEDADSLSLGQGYIERAPAYGLRTKTAAFHRRDVTMPGGQTPSWAMGMDGTSAGLLAVLRSFFQSYAITDGGTTLPSTWSFTPKTTNPASLAAFDLYTIAKVTGIGTAGNLWFADCVGVGLDGNWATGDVFKLKSAYQSMAVTQGGTPTGWGVAPTVLSTVGAAEMAWTCYVNGGTYTLYPSNIAFGLAYDAEDLGGAGVASRARITPGVFSGNCSLTVPRNHDLHTLTEAGNSYGTIAAQFRPTGGTYALGGTFTNNLWLYGKILRLDKPAGAGGDVTDTMEMSVLTARWDISSDTGSAAL